MQFKEIVGQNDIKQRLTKSVLDNRIPHAQLFVGQAGVGKLALAIAYAQYISCLDKSEDDSCGKCQSCHKFEKLIHPDLHFVFPINENQKKGDDDENNKDSGKQNDSFLHLWRESILTNPYITESNWYKTIGLERKLGIISTNASSEVIKKISLKSFESEYKAMIIWLPERMNHYAANKLLKLIEEPPPKTIFLLITESPDNILSTIKSRTQIIKVPPISREEIATTLVEKYQFSPTKAQDVSRVANGNFQLALSHAKSPDVSPYFEQFRALMRYSFANNVLGLIDWVEEVSRLGREKHMELLTYSLQVIRESFMLNLGLEEISYLCGEEHDFGKKFAPFINAKNIVVITNEFNSAIEHISRNGNPQIIFTDLAMKLVKLINKK